MDFCNKSEDATSWEKFHVSISKEELYHEDDPMIDELLQDMTSLEFYNISKSFVGYKPVFVSHERFHESFCYCIFSFCVKIGQKEGGTQLKLVIEFAPGGMAMLKPMR